MTNTRYTHVPYKGGGPQVIALVAGESQVSLATVASVVQHIRAGRLRALGLSAVRRSSALPDVPTIAESGVPGYDMSPWIAAFAPAGTPRSIIDRLNSEINRALRLPDVAQNLSTQGVDPWPGTPEEFAARIKADYERYGKLIKLTGAKID
jgi:tripartite-type tricarboxylate transporter receptor subunit TctC